MSVPLTIEWRIVTNEEEKRINTKENIFEITFSGYRLFPIDVPIDIMRHEDSDQIGSAIVQKIIFEHNQTICRYQLVSLYSVN
ncbi:Protein of unknown function [Salinibacillus kushneri]|uniref:DUF2584 domain-containing protein n=1 Tax=Salinibacillus kushneri TaxID=237682 RepID=A0A1I0DJ56_9BACI|nr:DUF2584 family protein [Salinibacillus kushneri]SET32491.1 Protein of unknown function [Salinibacillus kushneri]